jgi:hypothetical protein
MVKIPYLLARKPLQKTLSKTIKQADEHLNASTRRDQMDIRKITLPALVAILIALSAFPVIAYQKQSAAVPGEALISDGDETTAIQLSGLFAVEVTSTGVGTILIKRSEDNITWITAKTLTNTVAGDQRKFVYEPFGDGNIFKMEKAWYKAVLSDPTSGSFYVRLVK